VYLILIDYLIFLISYGLALLIRFQTDFAEMEKYIYPSLLYPVINVIIFKINNIYKSIWRFATLKELSPIFYSSIFGFMANIFIFVFIQRYLFEFVILPFSVAAITSLMGTFLVILSRVIWFSKANTPVNNNEINYNKNLLIIGAGDAGTELLGEYLRNPSQGIVKGFLDDDSSKISRNIRGVKVLGSIDNVDHYVEKYDIDEIIYSCECGGLLEIKYDYEQIKEKVNPDEILMVIDAMAGQDAVNSAKIFNDRLDVSGFVVTKMDGDARGGVVLSIRYITNKPIKFIGVGEKIDDFEDFYPDRIANRILGLGDVLSLIEKAEQELDKEKMQKLGKKMIEADFTLEDFQEQLKEIKKLGSLSMCNLPAVSKIATLYPLSLISFIAASTIFKGFFLSPVITGTSIFFPSVIS